MLLTFASSGCGASQAAYEGLSNLHATLDSVQVVTYSVDVRQAQWLANSQEKQIKWQQIWDGAGPYGKANILYGGGGFPSFVLIGPNRKILARWSGYSPKYPNSIKEKVLKCLGGGD